MKIKVTKDLCEIKENEIWNVGDYNVHTVEVELSDEFNGLVNKVRYFIEDNSYDMLITDNVAQVPYEATLTEGTIKIGVYGYDTDTNILVQSTSPVNKYISSGTYTGEADNTEPLTPTDKQQMESAIQKNTDDIIDLQNNKQDVLISGTNIKTINNNSILGSGNISVPTSDTPEMNDSAFEITDGNGNVAFQIDEDGHIHTKAFDSDTQKVESLGGSTGNIMLGGGLSISNNVLTANGATSYWAGKTLIYTGDSIPHGQTMQGNVQTPYPKVIANNLGMTLKNYSIGGSTFAHKSWYGGAFSSQAEFDAATKDTTKLYQVITGQTYKSYEYINSSWQEVSGYSGESVTAYKAPRTPIVSRYQFMDDGDLIIVACGTNDFQYDWTDIGTMASRDETTFYGALHLICQGLLQKYFKKQIIFCTPIKRCQSTPIDYSDVDAVNSKNKSLKDYGDIIKEVCNYYSIPVIDLYADSMLNPHLQSQASLFDSYKTHPLQDGHNILGAIMSSRIEGIKKY